MANEARIMSGLQIHGAANGFDKPFGSKTSFQADVANPRGPSPGLLRVTSEPQAIDFSELTLPGLCEIWNLDTEITLEVGLIIGSFFYPVDDFLPGEHFVRRLSRYVNYNETLPGTGTGTADNTPNDAQFAVRMRGPAGVYSDVLINAFDS